MATFCSKGPSLLLVLIAGLNTMSLMWQVQGQGAASESAGMTWQAYWDKKLPHVQTPAGLAGLSSDMSPEEVAFYVGGIQQESVHTSPSLCRPQSMLCGPSAASGFMPCTSPFSYVYSRAGCNGNTNIPEGLFFKPEKLSKGSTLLYPVLTNNIQGRTFLPDQLAAVMPFQHDKLAAYMSLLEVPRDSSMAASMDYTLANCNAQPTNGEVHSCHSSIESMVDFATEQLGSHVAVMSLEKSPLKSEEVHVVRQAKLSRATSASIACHDLMFPYLVYRCHVMKSTNVYDMELKGANGLSIHNIAVCHDDTRSWSSTHPAFASLKAQPGDGAICHWLPQNSFLWVAS